MKDVDNLWKEAKADVDKKRLEANKKLIRMLAIDIEADLKSVVDLLETKPKNALELLKITAGRLDSIKYKVQRHI